MDPVYSEAPESKKSLVYAKGYVEERAIPTLPEVRETRVLMTAAFHKQEMK